VAERAARLREQYEDAERVVVATSSATAEAVSAEDRLEAEVRDLERRLTQARTDLAAARMRARHAEAAERRARQALDRIPRD
jgi:chromosome segregation ATPase